MKKFIPHTDQKNALRFLVERDRALLLAPMGSGKTVTLLSTLWWKQNKLGQKTLPALVVAPKNVCENVWEQEGKKWMHLQGLRFSICTGDKKAREKAVFSQADIYVINFESVGWLTEQFPGEWPFKSLIIDESAKLKAFRGGIKNKRLASGEDRKYLVTSSSVAGKVIARLALKTPNIYLATGTPTPRQIGDLWPQVWFADFGHRLGAFYTHFRESFMRPDPKYQGYGAREWVVTEAGVSQIQKAISDICYAMPSPVDAENHPLDCRNIHVHLPDAAREKYEKMARAFYVELQSHDLSRAIEASNAAVKSLRLLQMASGLAYTTDGGYSSLHTEKLEVLDQIYEESGGMPILVAVYWKAEFIRLENKFKKLCRILRTPTDFEDWNREKIPLGLISPASAGHGLNLARGGNIIVHLNLTWNMGNYAQVNERNGPLRQQQEGLSRGQLRYHILASDTLDDEVLQVLQGRMSVERALIQSMEKRKFVL